MGVLGVALVVLGIRIVFEPPASLDPLNSLWAGVAIGYVGVAVVGFAYLSYRRLEIAVDRGAVRSVLLRGAVAIVAMMVGLAAISLAGSWIYRWGYAEWSPVVRTAGSGSTPSVKLVNLETDAQQLWYSGSEGAVLRVFLIPAPEGTTPTVPLGGPNDLYRVVQVTGANDAVIELSKQPGRYVLYAQSTGGSWSVELLER